MRPLIVDYACHPFQYELATMLAARGHVVAHTYCASNVTPQTIAAPGVNLVICPVDLGRPFAKFELRKRLADEARYGWRTIIIARSFRPTHLLTSNVPLISLALLWMWAALTKTSWTLWLQDVQSGLASMVAGKSNWVSRVLARLEHFLLRRADRVVAISPEFRDLLVSNGVREERIDVIENWAPLDALPVRPKENRWAVAHDLRDLFVFLYSGTLGKKHSPELLLALADEFGGDDRVRVVVVAEGAGADWLRSEDARSPRKNLVQLPFQAFDDLPDVLGTGDVLITLLSAEAGAFSVPSKTLSYLCAQRPILAAIPAENSAARLVAQRAHAGLVVAPGDVAAFRTAARQMYEDAVGRARHAAVGACLR